MTTPPTTAGWYPDPDGSGGQRYWDGAAWTDEGPGIADTPAVEEQTSAWPAELPPWPEDMAMPSWEDAGKIDPADETAADAPDPQPDVTAAAEVAEAPHDEPDAVIAAAAEPQVGGDEPAAEVTSEATPEVRLPEQPPTAPPPPPAFVAAPAPVAAQPTPTGSPLKGYLVGVGALLVVLVGVLVWALGFSDPGTGTTEATGADESSETQEATAAATDSAAPSETAADVPAAGGQVTDGEVTITGKGVEITPTVAAVDNEMLTKTASGEFVVVRLTLLNNGELPATFLADQQVLNAGGQIYNTETESTFYLGGISAVLYPGTPVDVAVAFDVPPGTTPESVQVHGDLGSPGAILPLS